MNVFFYQITLFCRAALVKLNKYCLATGFKYVSFCPKLSSTPSYFDASNCQLLEQYFCSDVTVNVVLPWQVAIKTATIF